MEFTEDELKLIKSGLKIASEYVRDPSGGYRIRPDDNLAEKLEELFQKIPG